MGRRSATERVATFLLHVYRRMERLGLKQKEADGRGGSVEFTISQQHIADTENPLEPLRITLASL